MLNWKLKSGVAGFIANACVVTAPACVSVACVCVCACAFLNKKESRGLLICLPIVKLSCTFLLLCTGVKAAEWRPCAIC